MATTEKPLIERVQELPDDLQVHLRSYIEELLEQQSRQPSGPLRYPWAGALRDLRDQTTSVELQHRALEWIVMN